MRGSVDCAHVIVRVEEVARDFEGTISLAARDLASGATVEYHPARKCATASVIKLPILVHAALLAEEGLLSLDERVTLTDADKVAGSGILTQLTAGLSISLRDACVLMMAVSDNTATNLVIDRVGIEPVNARMLSFGLRSTRLFRKVFATEPPVSDEARRFGLGVTTPRDMLRLLTDIYAGRIGSAATSCFIREILAKQHYREGIPRLLPSTCRFEGKSGAIDAVRNDVGIVTLADRRAIALAIFCQRMPRPLWTCDNPGHLAIAQIAKLLVEHFAGA